MEMRNCAKCRKPFVWDGYRLCKDCREQDEEDFEKVKAYLQENRGADVEEIHEETGVEKDLILYFMRQGRLEIMDEGEMKGECQVCGRPIPEGRMCKECLAKLRKPLEEKAKGQQGAGQERERRRDSQRDSSRLYIEDRLKQRRGKE